MAYEDEIKLKQRVQHLEWVLRCLVNTLESPKDTSELQKDAILREAKQCNRRETYVGQPA